MLLWYIIVYIWIWILWARNLDISGISPVNHLWWPFFFTFCDKHFFSHKNLFNLRVKGTWVNEIWFECHFEISWMNIVCNGWNPLRQRVQKCNNYILHFTVTDVTSVIKRNTFSIIIVYMHMQCIYFIICECILKWKHVPNAV